MEKETLYREAMKWLIVAAAVTCIGVVTAATQSDTYSKREADRTHDSLIEQHVRDIDRLYDGIDQIQQNVDWLVRQEGGEPIRSDSEEGR